MADPESEPQRRTESLRMHVFQENIGGVVLRICSAGFGLNHPKIAGRHPELNATEMCSLS